MINCCTSRRSCVLPESSTCVTLFRALRIWGNMNRESLNPGAPDQNLGPGMGLEGMWTLPNAGGSTPDSDLTSESGTFLESSLTLVIDPLPFIR